MRISAIKRIEQLKGKYNPNYNPKACQFFRGINERFHLDGRHAENVGEIHIKELGYFVDYYSPELNLVIEWNEKSHYNFDGNLKAREQQRQKEITEHLKCTFININQSNFEQEKELILNKIQGIINGKSILRH